MDWLEQMNDTVRMCPVWISLLLQLWFFSTIEIIWDFLHSVSWHHLSTHWLHPPHSWSFPGLWQYLFFFLLVFPTGGLVTAGISTLLTSPFTTSANDDNSPNTTIAEPVHSCCLWTLLSINAGRSTGTAARTAGHECTHPLWSRPLKPQRFGILSWKKRLGDLGHQWPRTSGD